MLTCVDWINDYLDRPADAAEQAELLTAAGFPLEGTEDVAGGIQQDFEMTSNRGDCTCHVGLAREIAAASGRTLVLPTFADIYDPDACGPDIDPNDDLIHNHEFDACPRYTAHIIRGVKIGPSPDHIRTRLEVRGDVPRNNVVDATNFVLFELGQPTHAFDLDKLAGGRIEVRMARKGERFLPLGEDAVEIELNGTELVIADAEKPVALAGVKGGADAAVTESTTNLLIEAATFDPLMVRHTSRLHNIASDSSFRFERGVSPLQVDFAAERLCRLILDSAGGVMDNGMVGACLNMPDLLQVDMRPDRCRSLLGLDIDDATMIDSLTRLGFAPVADGDTLHCTVPCHRGDITREVDLIEEVMRMHGFGPVPVRERIEVKPVTEPVDARRRRLLADTLVAEGYVETVTHSLTDAAQAKALLGGTDPLQLDESRAMAEDALRPSLATSLLKVRKHNADHGAAHGMRLFELGSAFMPNADPQEQLELCLIADEGEDGIRPLRAAVDQVARVLGGDGAQVRVDAGNAPEWMSPGGTIQLDGQALGWLGRIDPSVTAAAGLDDITVLCASLRVAPWMSAGTEDAAASPPPAFPSIERDVSAIVEEAVSWTAMADTIAALDLPMHEATRFVTVYRGKGIDAGHKSVTLRLTFRADDRTLRHEEVDGPMTRVVDALKTGVGAQVRS